MSMFSRVIVPALMAALCLAGPPNLAGSSRANAQAAANQDQPSEETWNSIKGDIFKDRPILDGSGLVILDAPRRAEDSAVVPIGMRVNFSGDDKRTLKTLTLVIDENPAPVAATYTIGPRSGVTSISTRVRVNSYSYMRLVAELSDGQLYGVKPDSGVYVGRSRNVTIDNNTVAHGRVTRVAVGVDGTCDRKSVHVGNNRLT